LAIPTLTPESTVSAIALSATGSTTDVAATLPFGMYANSADFLSGAADQVAHTYKKLGGDILDIELTVGNVYAAYEEAVLEYSYLLNLHQSKNVLSDSLGSTTGTFDHDGSIKAGPLSSSLGGTHVGLKYPRFSFDYSRRISDGISTELGVGGTTTEYSASFNSVEDQQDYDLQGIISASAAAGTEAFNGLVGNKKVIINRVYYKTPQAMWRFYGYYGGLNTVGNLSNYGQYADDTTFQLVPTWQNKAQAMAFEDAIYTRNSHYSYEIKNNNLRIYPSPVSSSPEKYWVTFRIISDPWEEDSDRTIGIDGINNMNTLPFDNVPYENINAIGKQWVRRFALALAKEMLGQVRSKFATVPIPGESVTLNGPALISEGREEQDKLREELKTTLDELTYSALVESDADIVEASNKINTHVPNYIFVG